MSMVLPPFVEFQSIPRLTRPCIITEKIDGTNGVVYITEAGERRWAHRMAITQRRRSTKGVVPALKNATPSGTVAAVA